jgi:F-type H+-transporting ATPase subunit b
MLEIDWPSLAWQILNFVVLLLILNFFLFRPLRKKLNERGEVIAETLQRARDQEAEASQIRTEWEERMHGIEQQAEEIIHQAQQEALRKGANLLEETRGRLDRLTEEMRADLRRQRDEVVAQHYDDIMSAVLDLSGNVVQSVTTRRTHDDLVTNFAASIFQMPQAEIEQYRQAMSNRMPTAFVSTPVALTADQTKTMADTLSSLVDRRVELQVKVDPTLIAGVQVRLADKLIDNSVRQQLSRVRERVYQDLISRMGADA